MCVHITLPTQLWTHVDMCTQVYMHVVRLGSGILRSGGTEPFFCEGCRDHNHLQLRIAAVKRARQKRLSQEHELRGSESASASSSNVQSRWEGLPMVSNCLLLLGLALQLQSNHTYSVSVALDDTIAPHICVYQLSCVLFDDCGLDLCFSQVIQINYKIAAARASQLKTSHAEKPQILVYL